MTLTAPFVPRAELSLSESLEHVYAVVAITAAGIRIPLDLVDGALVYDEGWAPHVQASLTLAMAEVDVLDALDPRLMVRIEIAVGYRYPDRTEDVPVIAALVLRDRTVDRTGDTPVLRITAASDESLVQDAGIVASEAAGREHPVLWDLDEALRGLVPLALGSSMTMETTLPPVLVDTQPLWWSEWWPMLSAWVTEAEAWWYHDGLTGWRLSRRPQVASQAVHVLRTGPGGTITASQAALTREGEDWASEVWTLYRWRTADGVDRTATGHAWISDGPYRAYDGSTPRPGRKTLLYEFDSPASQASAGNAARALLKRRAAGGRSTSVTAVAAYWLRPGHTVTVQLPTGTQERHLVSRVAFSLPSGDMTVQTRLPSGATITTGE